MSSHTPDPLDDGLRLRAQSVPVGVVVTFVIVAALSVWVATTWERAAPRVDGGRSWSWRR